MRVREVSWQNYRRLPDAQIVVNDHLVLVGPNDTGKSSVLRAIHLCIGMPHGQLLNAISARDFTDADEPLRLSVTLEGIEDDDRAMFPDEITTGPPEVLVVEVEAVLDPTDPDEKTIRRYFPDGGHDRSPSRTQLKAIGFQYVSAVRSLIRELGGARGSAVGSLLSTVDLSADADALGEAAALYRDALDGAAALINLRGELADALSKALPTEVGEDDVRVVSESEILDDPLSGVTVALRDGERHVPLVEQSDGIRALSVITLLGMSQKGTRIVGIDEPETHLHPSAQRSVARTLLAADGQRVLATHSPSVVAAMNPMDIVAFGSDRRVRQLPPNAPIGDQQATVRHWSSKLIEPLTARRVVVVEGVSDQILFTRVAELAGFDLDRRGVAVFELGGADLFGFAYGVFGPQGFAVPLVGLLDEDARSRWAADLGVAADELEEEGFVVCAPDLEGAYIHALGVQPIVDMLLDAGVTSEGRLLNICNVAQRADLTDQALERYCRHRKRKVGAAVAVATRMTEPQALSITPLVDLLNLLG